MLAGGDIVIVDNAGKYYLVEDASKAKRYIACEHPQTPEEDFDGVIQRLKSEAMKRLTERKME